MMKNNVLVYAACLPGILMAIGSCAGTTPVPIETEYRRVDRYMLVRRDNNEYKDDAHGLGTTLYYVLDLTDNRVLNIRDFFRESTEERLYDIIKNDEPGVPDNLFISQEGMYLNWAPNETVPYEAGSIEILLPWKTIRPLLKHDAMELLEKFGIYMFM
jgi:hypothetical protein